MGMFDKLNVSISRRIVLLETLNSCENSFADTTSFFSNIMIIEMSLSILVIIYLFFRTVTIRCHLFSIILHVSQEGGYA
ncbi:hypothetical protein AOA57_15560, partial [Pseudomonas sp. 2588-5]